MELFFYFVELRRWIRDVLFVVSFEGYDYNDVVRDYREHAKLRDFSEHVHMGPTQLTDGILSLFICLGVGRCTVRRQ